MFFVAAPCVLRRGGRGDLDAARALVDSTERAELFGYPGDQHLFEDSSLDSYDPAATDLLVERVTGFLGRIGRGE